MENPEMFGVLFDRHFDRIARFCTRRVGTVQGEDIAGDVFRWAFENRQRFDPKRGAVLSWLFRIANNAVRHAQRSVGRRDLAYSQWSTKLGWQRADPVAGLVETIDAKGDLQAVATALKLQPTDEVETLLLFAWEGLSYSEVAEVLAIPVGTVRSRINRVRRHLHEVLDATPPSSDCTALIPGGLS